METTIALDKQKLEKAATILKTVAHPTRLAVVNLLSVYHRLGVNEMCERLNCEQSLLSHHLTQMRLRGILQCTREGQNMFYSLKERELIKLLECIENCDCNF